MKLVIEFQKSVEVSDDEVDDVIGRVAKLVRGGYTSGHPSACGAWWRFE